jgi:large subunit ribosomal protein L9
MATHDILLLKPVDNLGGEGDQVTVRAGYARNFLLPRKLAIPLTASNRKQIEALRRARGAREIKELDVARAVAEKIAGVHIAIAVRTGEGGRMFGAVTAADLHAKLTEAGVDIDRKRVQLHTPVKTLGHHTTKVKLHPDVVAELGFDVVSENPIIPAAE